jgi:putative tryptophan/tyrosine transport system substrate-binding protein
MIPTKRRTAITGAPALLLFGVVPARAQSVGRKKHIAFLSAYTREAGQDLVGCFRKGLADLGWTEGKDLEIEYRWADGRPDRLLPLAQELNGLGLDLIASNSTPAAQTLKRVVDKIPVVFMSVSDPVASGIVASLARPAGNFTGLSNFFPEVGGKLVDVAKTLLPDVRRLGVMTTPDNQGKELDRREVVARAAESGISVSTFHVRSAADIDAAFEQAGRDGLQALLVFVDPVTTAHRQQIVEAARRRALPAIYQVRDFVDAGGLLSYGLNFCKHFERAAFYADRILKGTKPADLPVELPSEFEMVVNMKAAHDLHLTLPQLILARAEIVNE